MTMVSLMMAPLYRRMGTPAFDGDAFYSGFSKWGSIIAVVMAVIISLLAYYFSQLFDRMNEAKHKESVELKKLADAKLRAEGGLA
jgi:hypothetical protein